VTATPAAAFSAWCDFLAPTEGVFSNDPRDPGNWTSGKPGVGVLKGTKFGIAASSHPDLDIFNLTLEQADGLRKSEYWDKVNGDSLPPAIAFMVADAAYGSGPYVAATELQAMLGVSQDGDIGPLETLPALRVAIGKPSAYGLASGLADVVTEYAARRLLFEARLNNWTVDQGGWTRRLFHSVVLSLALA
jgi:lysozyme family protein